jgi:hypothetical protein
LKRVNHAAAAETKSGDYASAQKWMEIGRSLAEFSSRAGAYAEEWKRLVRATRLAAGENEPGGAATDSGKQAPHGARHTPAWRFYTPLLKALAARSAPMSSADVIATIEPVVTSQLNEHDLRVGRGEVVPRWHRTVIRMRRQCQREGWIDKGKGDTWMITEKGRQIAAKDSLQT